MNESGRTGRRGEDAVEEFLIAQGHAILDRNWRSGHLELDLVSLDRNGLHFVEVKTRRAGAASAPEENVGYIKQRRIADAARRYLAKNGHRLGGVEVFFDVAAVTDTGKSLEINYFPSAFIPIG